MFVDVLGTIVRLLVSKRAEVIPVRESGGITSQNKEVIPPEQGITSDANRSTALLDLQTERKLQGVFL